MKMYKLLELEELLKVSRRTLLRYIYSGKLSATKVGRSWRVSQEELDRFLKDKIFKG